MSVRKLSIAAFSLIEVLIAVTVLAIGLLGLGAVIPVVIREQQDAGETTLAISARNSAEAYLAAADLDWASWLGAEDAWDTNPSNETLTARLGEGLNNRPTSAWLPMTIDPDTGAATDRNQPVSPRLIQIPLAERLFPSPRSGQEPRLVWDVAARRMIERNWGPDWESVQADREPNPQASDRIQLALFMRAIDPGIRRADGVPLGRLLLSAGGSQLKNTTNGSGSNRPTNAPWPVAVDSNGRPTRNGIGDYSVVYAAPLVQYDLRVLPEGHLLIGFEDANNFGVFSETAPSNVSEEDLTRFASQPGQKLVDAWGTVYTVEGQASRRVVDLVRSELGGGDPSLGFNPRDHVVVRISPNIPEWIRSTDQLGDLCFTPQVPAEVVLLEVSP